MSVQIPEQSNLSLTQCSFLEHQNYKIIYRRYASLYFIVGALARSGLAASSVFPLMNIGVILFGTLASMHLFKERLRAVQWVGLACALIALVLILSPGT